MKLVVSVIVFALFKLARAQNECTFNVTNPEYEQTLPVLLYNLSSTYELAIPNQGTIVLTSGQNISLLCSGNRNYVRQTNSNVTTVTCLENQDVKLYRKVYKFHDIKCKHAVRGDVRKTEEKCGNGQGVVYEIGYPVSRRDWVTLITVCHVPEIGHTLYTRHLLHGKEIKYASKSSYRPGFSTAGLDSSIPASVAYKQTFQKATFSSILKSSELSNHFVTNKSYLSRGHLSPDADFLQAPTQFSTYYYLNTAPQWQNINAASWNSIEFTVRKLAELYGDLEVITGTHDVLTYKDKEGHVQEICLGPEGKLPVPKYFWKLAYEEKSNRAIVFIILNDPYVQSLENEVFCNDICQSEGFTKKSWKDLHSGYVFCCSYPDFLRVVKTAPRLTVDDVLSNPQ
ncbi:uncharacterized protein LOC126733940 [Anthonomus grandis grandis]|uniref:uncharacterized protein LOC126733940 n=1 Tax=Anthonomus grandis grandis TaxID=2921223 RepID=UPI0021666D1A|nr:uncharacterized protein LOC126733940 [Anthonomus grandis grandis]